MRKGIICCPQHSEAIRFAGQYLSSLGLPVTDSPGPEAAHLLLPVPSFPAGDGYLEHILSDVPETITISGGNLDIPALKNYRTVDFLQDPRYLADNAAITADCALEIVENNLGAPLTDCPVLVLGWGRIGKCLGRLLQDKGADVTIAARKEGDLAMIHALGCHSIPISQVGPELEHYRVILNTVPEMILPAMHCRPDCIAVELASRPGMAGCPIISARGLPGKMAPAASGKLIAETFIRLSLKEEQ